MNRAIINPATGQVIREIADSTTQEVDEAISRALNAFTPWSELTPGERSKKILDYADLLEKHADEICELEVSETGKPWSTMRDGEFPFGLDNLRFFAGAARSLDGTGAGSFNHGYTSLLVRKPVGVIGSISPWNFPFIMAIWKIGPALAAGNTVVIKPAPQTPSSTIKLIELAKQIFAPGTIEVILGDAEVAQQLVKDPRISMVSITGSSDSGRKVMQAASETTKRVHLELGGKAANLVFEDAAIDEAVEGIINGIFFNQGHVCCAGSRLIIQENVADEVLEKLKKRMSLIRVGDPMDKNTDLGAINSKEQLNKIEEISKTGDAEGANRWSPDVKLPTKGFWYPPTIFTGVTQSHRIAREEIFGPVLSVLTFRTPAEAIEKANNTMYGLSAGIWSDKGAKVLWAAKQLKAGVIWSNTFNKFDPASPFGGYKESGWGREGGRHGLAGYLTSDSKVNK